MLVYYDIVADKEVGSDSYDSSVPVPGIKALQSKRITIKEGEVDIGANASKGDGESSEDGEDESVDASSEKTVINIVEASHLQKIDLEKKEYKTLVKNYFKKLLEKLTKNRLLAAGFAKNYEAPEDKAEAKTEEEKMVSELSKFEKKRL